MDAALADFHTWRDDAFSKVFEYYRRAATLDALPPDLLPVLDALRYDAEQRDRFMGITGGHTSFQEFFEPENCARILSKAAAAGHLVDQSDGGGDSSWSGWLR